VTVTRIKLARRRTFADRAQFLGAAVSKGRRACKIGRGVDTVAAPAYCAGAATPNGR